MPRFHPTEEMLLDYAAGSLSEAIGLLVATHLALCPTCRERVRELEALGGLLLDSMPAVPVRTTADDILARLATPQPSFNCPKPAERCLSVPRPLRDYLPAPLETMPWRQITRHLGEIDLPVGSGTERTKLMRIGAGSAIPRHTHPGSEYILVLSGGFSDSAGQYGRGDVAVADDTIQHRPVADADGDCLCLAVIDGGLRLTGPIGRLINLFYKF